MKRTTAKALFIVTGVLLAGLLNLIAFMLPFSRTESFWAGYGFSMGALVIFILAGILEFLQKGRKSKFYGLPAYGVVIVYVVIQLALGILEMFFSFFPLKLSLLLNLLLLVLILLGLIAAGAPMGFAAHIDKTTGEKREFLRSLGQDLDALADKERDPQLRKTLKSLAGDVRFSDPVSGPEAEDIEREIADAVKALKLGAAGSPNAQAALDDLRRLLGERNQKVRAMK